MRIHPSSRPETEFFSPKNFHTSYISYENFRGVIIHLKVAPITGRLTHHKLDNTIVVFKSYLL